MVAVKTGIVAAAALFGAEDHARAVRREGGLQVVGGIGGDLHRLSTARLLEPEIEIGAASAVGRVDDQFAIS